MVRHLAVDKKISALPMNRIFLLPYLPELNPAERIFEEVRRETILYR